MSVRLSSLTDLKSELRIPAAETAYDTILASKLEATGADCEAFCQRSFTYASYSSEKHHGGCSTVVIKNPPIDSGASFVLIDYESASALQTTISSLDYYVDCDSGVVTLLAGGRFSDGPNAAQVTYVGGYASTGTGDTQKVVVPDDLAASVKELAAARFRKQQGAISAADLEAEEKRARAVWSHYKLHGM